MTEAPEPNRLFLLDGMALVYRAHFALIRNPIINSKGNNTSALFGFTNTLLSIIQSEKPTHLAVAWDTSAPTPRHEKYPEYKANRDEMPEELRSAIPACKELCRAFAIPLLEIDGYEADDLIGTLAQTADDKGDFHTFMVTPDKDFAQLISPRSTMWKPGRKGSDYEAINLDKLTEIWGVAEPHQIIDLLGLMGDSADNIPGVPGIGPKTAVKLIAQFGSIEELLKNTDKLKGKQKENVENNKENALLSKDLATIIRDAPLDVSFEDLTLSPYNEEAIQKLFAEYEFRSLSKRLFGDKAQLPESEASADSEPLASLKSIADTKPHYQLVNSPKQEKELFAALEAADSFCFDLETTSLNRFKAKILGVAFSLQPGTAYYLPYNRVHHNTLKALLTNSSEKIGHNLKFDLHILNSHGIQAQGPFFDTLIVHALLYPEQRHTMDRLAENLLNYQTIKLADLAAAAEEEKQKAKDSQTEEAPHPPQDDLFAFAEAKKEQVTTSSVKKNKPKGEIDMKAIPLEALAEYAAEDADITLQLAHHLRPLLEENKLTQIYQTIEAPLLPVLVQMEAEGIALDPTLLAQVGNELSSRIDKLSEQITTAAGQEFNLNSPKQLGEILFEKLKLDDKPKKTKTGQYKTNEQTLSVLAIEHPIAAHILLYRQATKLKSTYVDALPDDIAPHDQRIHTHLHQHIAATGRLASSDPNLQNIPIRSELGREIRKAFVPRGLTEAQTPSAGSFTLFAADYSQIELRIMAALSGDPSMIEAFQNDRDIHTETAAKVYGVPSSEVTNDHRRTAKMVNFGIIYGISAFGLAQRLSIPRGEASDIIKAYWTEYPKIKEFMNTTIESAKEKGYTETLSGRRRYFPDINSGNGPVRANAERAAINTPIQGTAADMIKLAMINSAQLLEEQQTTSKMLLQVHDELLFDLHQSEADSLPAQIITTMETALVLPNNVPIKVETGTGQTWLEAH